jgi:uncharacterized protein
VLAHALAAIASSGGPQLIFKGGTSLRLIHFEDYRYSADLDFSIVGGTEEDAKKAIEAAFQKAHKSSVSRLTVTTDNPPKVSYLGPLQKERTIKLDLSADEKVVNTEKRLLLPHWPDLPKVEVLVYTLLEITAEKLRCVLQRLQCRDLFDLRTLLTNADVNIEEAVKLFAIKAKHKGLNPDSFGSKYAERIAQYEKRWEGELQEHIPGTVPHFAEVERQVARSLRQAGLL